MIYSTKESRTESLFRKIRNSVKEINEAVEKLEKAQLFSEGTTSDQHVATDTNVGDTISRQAVYDALNNIQIPRNESWYCYYQQALTAVSKLPSAQPEQRWIPCGEGIPKKMGYYICTCHDGVCYRTSVLKWSIGWVLTGARSYWKVIAWMPLPEPWKGE